MVMDIDVSHIAKLANLPISKEEKGKFEKQLGETISYIDKLGEINTVDIQSTSQVTGLENVTRDDVIAPSLSQEEVLKNAKSVHNGFFKVKAILEE